MLEQLEVLIKCIFELILLILNPIFSIPIFIFITLRLKSIKKKPITKLLKYPILTLDIMLENMENI